MPETQRQPVGKNLGPEAPADPQNLTLEGRPSYALQEVNAGKNQEQDLNFSHSGSVVSSDALPDNTRLR